MEKLKKSSLLIPPSFVNNYDDWRCRSFAGRALLAMEDYNSAIPVLASVLDVEPDLQDRPAEGFSQAEHKVLCLTDMVELIMGLANNPEAALRYQNEAVKLCEKFQGEFITANPEKIWQKKIELLRLAGREGEAKALANTPWQPAAKLKEREILDMEEVRHRQGSQGAKGSKPEDFLTGFGDVFKKQY